MFEKENLKEIIKSQQTLLKDINLGYIREEYLQQLRQSIRLNYAVAIMGPRRAGKSTILYQFMPEIKNDYYYLNFDDERLFNFKLTDFENLLLAFYELYGNSHKYFLFDEIQNINSWELFINRLLRSGKYVIITGSNLTLTKGELATKLTGRHIDLYVYPFSFKEYIFAKKVNLENTKTTEEKAILDVYFQEYFLYGGFPDVLVKKDIFVLQALYNDIITKDVFYKKQILVKELSNYLMYNVSTLVSLNNLAKFFKLRNNSIPKKIIEILTDSFLFNTIDIYSHSYKQRIANAKKVYAIDVGLVHAISTKILENKGLDFENIVFLELKRRYKDVYYFKENGLDVDFIVVDKNKNILPIQVCYDVSIAKTKKREEDALLNIMNKLKIKEGIIITKDYKAEVVTTEYKIKYIKVIDFLLD